MNYFDDETKNQTDELKKNNTFPDEFFWLDSLPAKKSDVRRNMAYILLYLLIIITLIFASMVITEAYFGKNWIENALKNDKNVEVSIPLADRPKLEDEMYREDGRYTVEGAAAAVSPSVVMITTMPVEKEGVISQGSGVFLTEDGYIATNAHVIGENEDIMIRVQTTDGMAYQAKVIGLDITSDLAVLKIYGNDPFLPAQFGDSNQVVVGEEVLVIGSPAGLEGTVTRGIVSAVGREVTTESVKTTDCIQVDAEVNPGNSGGALVNMWGQVIGIVSAKIHSETYSGIGFAISTDFARPVLEDLMEHGCVAGRVKIGITFYQITAEQAKELQIPQGLIITQIDESCDIANTELQIGDVITHLNGKEVKNADDVTEVLKECYAEDTVTAKVFSPEKEYEISFKLMDNSNTLVAQ